MRTPSLHPSRWVHSRYTTNACTAVPGTRTRSVVGPTTGQITGAISVSSSWLEKHGVEALRRGAARMTGDNENLNGRRRGKGVAQGGGETHD